jgi:hypothetical protein
MQPLRKIADEIKLSNTSPEVPGSNQGWDIEVPK